MPDYLTQGDQADSPIKRKKTVKTKAARRRKGGMSRNPTKGKGKRGK